jgi:7-cyano-7-deazaguanine reductase
VTGQPDIYDLKLSYRPGEQLLESKELKPYLWGFKERGIFDEFVTASTPAEYDG